MHRMNAFKQIDTIMLANRSMHIFLDIQVGHSSVKAEVAN
jgi:hypothetical protein